MGDLSKTLLDAIEVLADDKISKAGYDRSIIMNVVEAYLNSNKYKVSHLGSYFYAYSNGETYSKGDSVYVLIPLGDMSKTKIITGKANLTSNQATKVKEISFHSTGMIYVYGLEDTDFLPLGTETRPYIYITGSNDIEIKNARTDGKWELNGYLFPENDESKQLRITTKISLYITENFDKGYTITFVLKYKDKVLKSEIESPVEWHSTNMVGTFYGNTEKKQTTYIELLDSERYTFIGIDSIKLEKNNMDGDRLKFISIDDEKKINNYIPKFLIETGKIRNTKGYDFEINPDPKGSPFNSGDDSTLTFSADVLYDNAKIELSNPVYVWGRKKLFKSISTESSELLGDGWSVIGDQLTIELKGKEFYTPSTDMKVICLFDDDNLGRMTLSEEFAIILKDYDKRLVLKENNIEVENTFNYQSGNTVFNLTLEDKKGYNWLNTQTKNSMKYLIQLEDITLDLGDNVEIIHVPNSENIDSIKFTITEEIWNKYFSYTNGSKIKLTCAMLLENSEYIVNYNITKKATEDDDIIHPLGDLNAKYDADGKLLEGLVISLGFEVKPKGSTEYLNSTEVEDFKEIIKHFGTVSWKIENGEKGLITSSYDQNGEKNNITMSYNNSDVESKSDKEIQSMGNLNGFSQSKEWDSERAKVLLKVTLILGTIERTQWVAAYIKDGDQGSNGTNVFLSSSNGTKNDYVYGNTLIGLSLVGGGTDIKNIKYFESVEEVSKYLDDPELKDKAGIGFNLVGGMINSGQILENKSELPPFDTKRKEDINAQEWTIEFQDYFNGQESCNQDCENCQNFRLACKDGLSFIRRMNRLSNSATVAEIKYSGKKNAVEGKNADEILNATKNGLVVNTIYSGKTTTQIWLNKDKIKDIKIHAGYTHVNFSSNGNIATRDFPVGGDADNFFNVICTPSDNLKYKWEISNDGFNLLYGLNQDDCAKWNKSDEGRVWYTDWKENTISKVCVKVKSGYNNIDTFHLYIMCTIYQGEEIVGVVYFPIWYTVNLYENAFTNAWDGQTFTTDGAKGLALGVLFGAGSKDKSNKFTGVYMGAYLSENETTKEKVKEHGLFGYNQGERTFKIDSIGGGAQFGKNGACIVIDPTKESNDQDKPSAIYGGNINWYLGSKDIPKIKNINDKVKTYEVNGNGMIIDFTNGCIATQHFQLDSDGGVSATQIKIENKYENKDKTTDEVYQSSSFSVVPLEGKFSLKASGQKIMKIEKEGSTEEEKVTYNTCISELEFHYKVVDSEGNTLAGILYDPTESSRSCLKVWGHITATSGTIGGWEIGKNTLTAYTNKLRLCSDGTIIGNIPTKDGKAIDFGDFINIGSRSISWNGIGSLSSNGGGLILSGGGGCVSVNNLNATLSGGSSGISIDNTSTMVTNNSQLFAKFINCNGLNGSQNGGIIIYYTDPKSSIKLSKNIKIWEKIKGANYVAWNGEGKTEDLVNWSTKTAKKYVASAEKSKVGSGWVETYANSELALVVGYGFSYEGKTYTYNTILEAILRGAELATPEGVSKFTQPTISDDELKMHYKWSEKTIPEKDLGTVISSIPLQILGEPPQKVIMSDDNISKKYLTIQEHYYLLSKSGSVQSVLPDEKQHLILEYKIHLNSTDKSTALVESLELPNGDLIDLEGFDW